MTYSLKESESGVDVVVTGPWTSRAGDALRTGEADGLVLNYALGFQGRNLEFLQDLPIRKLDILARTISDLAPVYNLGETLTNLSVQSDGRFQLDLGRLPLLRSVSATWPQVRASITAAPQLEDCFFLSYDDTDLIPLVGLSELKTLRMKDRPAVVSLLGLENLPALTNLGLFGAPALTDLSALTNPMAPSLRRLEVESCRGISSLEEISACRDLTVLNAANCGDIQSLRPIVACSKLEAVWMWESTRIVDGDLSPLLRLPKLKHLAMMNRRAYSPKVQEIKAAIELRK